ncbi:hypothetical protein QQS21_011238 [Conoideocrella luteorostrata]|uniref:Zn(2)-C6 fungal-type domain-containing protein n=1 Tax=Conoideocrella luteorostrata TaxID=1105319 RepID=A0AAJ0CG81_9HYPO|nr:hypothetical protein QQS21_011238 [Conoideocrella luteorostrata]
MDLDPRLHSNHAGKGVPSADAGGPVNASSTSSPSSQAAAAAATHHRSVLHHGADGSDRPSSSHDTSSRELLQQQRNSAEQDADGAAGGDAKKSRACEACRGLKVRCEPDANDDSAPCKRCKKAGRSCVVTMPTRKRQKKTDSRVSELEKKIDALTASLQARTSIPGNGGHGSSAAHAGQQEDHIGGFSGSPTAGQQQQRSSSTSGAFPGLWVNSDSARSWTGLEAGLSSHSQAQGMTASPVQKSQAARSYRPSVFDPPEMTAGHKRKATFDYQVSPVEESSNVSPPTGGTSQWPISGPAQRSDIIDRGVISMEKAAELFQRYQEHMLQHLPAVVFPPSLHVMELRRSKPYLFLAVIAAASSDTQQIQRTLQRELMELFAEKIVIVGEKNLELVQALHVAVIWYWPPEHFEELKFYQLVHMAAVMALDIGLGKKSAPRRGIAGFNRRDQPFKRQPQPEPTSLECRRAWLTCHFLAANTSMSLHRPNLIRWSPFMTESLEMLRTSPDAYPTDKYFCHLIWSHHMAEDIGVQLAMDDPDTAVNIMDVRTQYTLRGLERDLDRYIGLVPKEMMQPTLKMAFGILNLYMHELALHSDGEADHVSPPFSTDNLQDGIVSSEPLSAAHINALSACLRAIDNIFQTFLAMDVFAIRCLPVFTFVRVAYAVVILMKMYFSASSPSSELGKVINKETMRVAYYLEALLEKFSATAADDKCRPASKFLLVLVMLRSWFLKHGKADGKPDGNGTGNNTSGSTPGGEVGVATAAAAAQPPDPSLQSQFQQQQQQQQQESSSATTPLQVLSEVAMNRESTSTPSRPYYNSISAGQPPPPSQTQPQTTTTNTTAYYQEPPLPHPWMNTQQVPPVPDMQTDMTIGFPAGFDFESLGVPLNGSGEMYGGGAKMVMNDPLFSDMFQGLPDPNFFSF